MHQRRITARRRVRPARLVPLFAHALAGLALACGPPAHAPSNERGDSGTTVGSEAPECIILIVADMLRRDHVGVYGGPATPHIDALARSGQWLPNALASFHQTSMSMGAMFTGRTPSLETGDRAAQLPWTGDTWCGMARLRSPDVAEPAACIPASVPTLAESLAQLGYWTLGVVSNELLFGSQGFERGFARWVEVDRRSAPAAERRPRPGENNQNVEARLRNGERVNRAAKAALARRESDRLFLYLHYMDVHDYGFAGVSYDEGVAAFDRALGDMLAFLRDEGLLEAAVVVLVSDHGEVLDEEFPLPAYKHYGNPSFEPVLQIPLIVSPAALASPPALVRTQDVRDLILEIAGRPAEPAADLAPDEVFVTEQKWQTYRRGHWKSAWPRREAGYHLFDLASDPRETRDVTVLHPEVVARHKARIEELTTQLAARGIEGGELTDEDRRRLRALGYAEE